MLGTADCKHLLDRIEDLGRIRAFWKAEYERGEKRIEELESGLRECREAVKYTGSYESVTKLVDDLLGDEV
jgi:hypothetical protein